MEHILYKTIDVDTPDVICDSNGEVVLGLCRVCGRGEIELEGPCPGRLPTHTEINALRARISELLQFNNEFEERARLAERRCAILDVSLDAALKRIFELISDQAVTVSDWSRL
jgi:hypothetical protein